MALKALFTFVSVLGKRTFLCPEAVILWCWPKGSRAPQARLFLGIEWFSIECRKTTTKVISPANQRTQSNLLSNQNSKQLNEARENLHEQVTIGFGLVVLVLRVIGFG